MTFAAILVLILGFFVYFAPSCIAFARGHRNLVPLALLNIVFGWTFIFWFVCLIWALWSKGD